MKLYFAGQSPIDFNIVFKCGVKNILQSFFYLGNEKQNKFAKDLNSKCNMFLDSGAFSAMTQKKYVNIDKYIKYIKWLNPYIYAGLDVIGNAKASNENISYMETQGVNPIPTFHRGSDLDYLYKMLDNYEYIALGGLAGTKAGATQIKLWLDRIFSQIKKRNPNIRVHGFACSGINVMKYYPWYSVDSTSWLAPVIFGREVDGLDNEAIKKKAFDENPEIYADKKLQREVILKESIKYFLKLEEQTNKHHDKSEFQHLSQGDLFE